VSNSDDKSRKRLRAANPLRPEQAPSPTSPRGETLFQRIIHTPRAEPEKPFWRRRWALLVLVPAVVLVCAAGYALLSRASDPLVVACFKEPSLDSDRAVVSLSGDDFLAACRTLWEPGGEFNPQGSPAPPLTSCLLEEGGLAVFPELPNLNTCLALGLEPATGEEIGDEHRAIQEVQKELSAQFLGACLGQEEATALVQQSLRRHGLLEWRVATQVPFTKDRPCATLAFDLPSRTIALVPTPGGP
jgi:hypothetical protein